MTERATRTRRPTPTTGTGTSAAAARKRSTKPGGAAKAPAGKAMRTTVDVPSPQSGRNATTKRPASNATTRQPAAEKGSKRSRGKAATADKPGARTARSTGRRDALPAGVLEQIDTTPGDAAGAILLAAMELMGSKGPAKVSLRDIASRAGVNYGLIHRHFGTKDSLLLGIFQAFTDYGASIIRSSDTIHDAVEGTFNADAGRYADLLASAVLDGMDPHRLYVDSSGMADFAAHIAREWAEPSDDFERRAEFDPRVVGSVVMLMIVVWDFYAPYMQVVNGYEDRELPDVRGEVLDLMKFLVTATAPVPGPRRQRGDL